MSDDSQILISMPDGSAYILHRRWRRDSGRCAGASASGRFSFRGCVHARSTLLRITQSLRDEYISKREQDEETAQPKLFYSKVRNLTRPSFTLQT